MFWEYLLTLSWAHNIAAYSKTQKCKPAVEENPRNALEILNVLTDIAPILLARGISQWLWGAKKYTQRLKNIEARLRKVFLLHNDTKFCSQQHKT